MVVATTDWTRRVLPWVAHMTGHCAGTVLAPSRLADAADSHVSLDRPEHRQGSTRVAVCRTRFMPQQQGVWGLGQAVWRDLHPSNAADPEQPCTVPTNTQGSHASRRKQNHSEGIPWKAKPWKKGDSRSAGFFGAPGRLTDRG